MTTITTLEQLQALPVETVLLCRLEEVFQLKTTTNGEHAWYALGYGDRTWTPDEILEYQPLEVIHTPRSNDDLPPADETRQQALERILNRHIITAAHNKIPALAVELLEALDDVEAGVHS